MSKMVLGERIAVIAENLEAMTAELDDARDQMVGCVDPEDEDTTGTHWETG